VRENPFGGYHIHVILSDIAGSVLRGATQLDQLAPPDAPRLAGMSVFEDVVVLDLQGGQSLVLHVTDPAAAGSVLFFYRANGVLWRAVPLEQLNPGWVLGQYHFRPDLAKFDARLARIRQRFAPPQKWSSPTFWRTGGWQGAVVYTAQGLVGRVWAWQHTPDLTQPTVVTPSTAQVEAVPETPSPEIQALSALQERGVAKVTYQVGGLHLVLTYVERIGLAAAVDRRCPRQGGLSEGVVLTILVVNRLLAPCALSNVAAWVKKTGLHLLLGISNPDLLNYDRLADALLAVYPHWQEIAAEVTLQAVERFRLQVEMVHYDLTSVFFHGDYAGSQWVEFGYSRDHRPDRPQACPELVEGSTSAWQPPPTGRWFCPAAAMSTPAPPTTPRRPSLPTTNSTASSSAATSWSPATASCKARATCWPLPGLTVAFWGRWIGRRTCGQWSPTARTRSSSLCPSAASGPDMPSRPPSVTCASRSKRSFQTQSSNRSEPGASGRENGARRPNSGTPTSESEPPSSWTQLARQRMRPGASAASGTMKPSSIGCVTI
jgi:hypothetical protein